VPKTPLDPLTLLADLPRVLPAPVVVTDAGGTILHLNPAMEAVCGWSSAELVGRPVGEVLIPEEDQAWFAELFRSVVSLEMTRPLEVRVRTRGGGTRLLAWSYAVLPGPGGEPEAVLATGTDLTELRVLEEREAAARASEARLSGIVEIASEAIISVDGDHRITLFNHGAEATFGYAASEVLGRPLEILLPESARGVHRGHVARFADSETPARRMGERQEISGLRKDGTEFPAEASILKLDVDGQLHFTVMLRDVSARMRRDRAQAFLAKVGQVFQGSLDVEETLRSVASLTVTHLADFCIIDVMDENEGSVRRVEALHRDPGQAEVATGFATLDLDRSRPHLMGEALREGIPILRRHVTREYLDSVAQGEHHRALLHALDARSCIVVPLKTRGRTVGALLCMRCGPGSAGQDAAPAPRPYDEEDLELARELALRAATAIDNACLYRDAQRAIEARDEVLGIVSHDLGNPLQAIFIGLEAMERSRAGRASGRPGQEEYYLTAIRRSVEVMERLIQDLLEVRRMEAGHLELHRAPRELGTLVVEALEMLSPLAQVKAIRIENEVPATGIPTLELDSDRIQQVLSNLVGNALKHTPEEGRVGIYCHLGDTEVEVRVEDTGPGIPAADLERVFDRFWTAGKGRSKGVGLGLAIARGIVRGHGGRIWAESREGAGSTFAFTLPIPPDLTGSSREDADGAGGVGGPD
jgi:PAS domain S-box-containing protein